MVRLSVPLGTNSSSSSISTAGTTDAVTAAAAAAAAGAAAGGSSGGAPLTLMSDCSYAQWVPGGDVAVGQVGGSRVALVWYDTAAALELRSAVADAVPVPGDVCELQRSEDNSGGACMVVSVPASTTGDGGGGGAPASTSTQLLVPLDARKLSFAGCIDNGDLWSALLLRQALGDPAASSHNGSPSTAGGGSDGVAAASASQWHRLLSAALTKGNLPIAQQCCAALGDAARSDYLGRVSVACVWHGCLTQLVVVFLSGAGALAILVSSSLTRILPRRTCTAILAVDEVLYYNKGQHPRREAVCFVVFSGAHCTVGCELLAIFL